MLITSSNGTLTNKAQTFIDLVLWFTSMIDLTKQKQKLNSAP